MSQRQARPAPVPDEPLPGPALDSHTHLDMLGDPDAVLADARRANVTRVVTVGCDLESSAWAADCAAGRPDVYATAAIHPNETARAGDRDEALAAIAALAELPQVRAVGETGLDYYRDSSPPAVQRDWFRGHIEIANRTGRALMIHDRDAHDDVLAILEAEGPPDRVIFHCFSGDAAMAKQCSAAGYVLSFAGTVTFPNAVNLHEAAVVTPVEQILVETDAPYLTPVPNRGKINNPAQVAHTLRAIAGLKRMDVAELCAAVTATGERVFGPWFD